MSLAGLLGADRRATDDRGWTLDLAVFRIAFVGGIALPGAWAAMRWTERVMPGLPPEAWRPIALFDLLPPEVLRDAALARGAALALIALLVLGLAGAATRLTLGAAALVALYVFGLPQNQGKVTHDQHMVWFLALLAAGPSGAMLGWRDALARLGLGAARAPSSGSPHALATLRYVWALMGLLYLGPGAAKLYAAIERGWLEPESLRAIIWRTNLGVALYEGATPPLGTAAAGLPGALLTLGGAAVIALECGFLPAVFVRRLRPLAAAAGLAFHVMNGLTVRIWFAHLTPAYAALVDWSALLARARGAGASPGAAAAEGAGLAAPPPGRAVALHALGGALVALQLGMTALQLGTRVADGLDAPPRPWSRLQWPFDCYPTFIDGSREATYYQVRLVGADGREEALEPWVYRRAFVAASRAGPLLRATAAEADPARARERWAAVVGALLAYLPEARRAAVAEARVYETRHSLAGAAPALTSERRLIALPAEAIARRGEAPPPPAPAGD